MCVLKIWGPALWDRICAAPCAEQPCHCSGRAMVGLQSVSEEAELLHKRSLVSGAVHVAALGEVGLCGAVLCLWP